MYILVVQQMRLKFTKIFITYVRKELSSIKRILYLLVEIVLENIQRTPRFLTISTLPTYIIHVEKMLVIMILEKSKNLLLDMDNVLSVAIDYRKAKLL